MTENDPLLDAIKDDGTHDKLLLYCDLDSDPAEKTLDRLLEALPYPTELECGECGRELEIDGEWTACRLKVASTDHHRTDLFCGPNCIVRSLTGLGIAEIEPISPTAKE